MGEKKKKEKEVEKEELMRIRLREEVPQSWGVGWGGKNTVNQKTGDEKTCCINKIYSYFHPLEWE